MKPMELDFADRSSALGGQRPTLQRPLISVSMAGASIRAVRPKRS